VTLTRVTNKRVVQMGELLQVSSFDVLWTKLKDSVGGRRSAIAPLTD